MFREIYPGNNFDIKQGNNVITKLALFWIYLASIALYIWSQHDFQEILLGIIRGFLAFV